MPGSPSPDRSEMQLEERLSKSTRLESIEDIKRAVKARRSPALKENPPEEEAITFRPLRRPPIALLCILDDGLEDGEWLRLRDDQYTIGRTEGEICIPHDTMISGRHALLNRRLETGRYRWYLSDLESTNGTYVRIGDAVLKHQQELLIGSRRYRFDFPAPGAAADDGTEVIGHKAVGTSGWQSVSLKDIVPSLVELTTKGEGQRLLLKKADNWLGRNASRCDVVIAGDPLVDPRHVRLYRDAKGRWHGESGKTRNGTWLRIEQMALDSACQFQLGEQRFLLKVL